MKKRISSLLSILIALSSCTFTACQEESGPVNNGDALTLTVASWDEYIDEGGSFYEDEETEKFRAWFQDLYGVDLTTSQPIYEEFEAWYFNKTGKEISVEYIPLQDNETMYNKIKMGDSYDLLCPSEYMMMKLQAEGLLQEYPDSFFDTTNEENYYARNLSPYIKQVFDDGNWTKYIAGYMWGSTGFVYNTDIIQPNSVMESWSALTSEACNWTITAKDNARDSYFAGLGLYYENELLALKANYESGKITYEEYRTELENKMNDTSDSTIQGVKKKLEAMRGNLYGLETDEGKMDVAMGRIGASYQWSGDAVAILDKAGKGVNLEYSIPQAASNLWFDGWTMMKHVDEETAEAAMMFINYLSRPENVIRNMYYIGYTSCIAGDDVFNYISDQYSATEVDTDVTEYSLDYFFGEGHKLIVPVEATKTQLFAQYPDEKTKDRLVVMRYFDKEVNEKVNRMWINIK